jgi:hypothetical protein
MQLLTPAACWGLLVLSVWGVCVGVSATGMPRIGACVPSMSQRVVRTAASSSHPAAPAASFLRNEGGQSLGRKVR